MLVKRHKFVQAHIFHRSSILSLKKRCLRHALATHHKYECPLGLYFLLRSILQGCKGQTKDEMERTGSVSVGKLLALRIATQTPLNLIESYYYEDSTKNTKSLLKQKHQDFASPYHQFMALAQAPLPKTDEYFQDQIVFEALFEMLVSAGDYPIPSFGSKAMVSLLSLWTRIIDANCFAVEVLWPFPRRKSGLCANTFHQKEGRRRQTGLTCRKRPTSHRLRQIGSAVYGASSYFNHSCDPNLTFAFGSHSHGQMCRLLLLGNEEGCRKANDVEEYDDDYANNSMLATAFEALTTTTCTTTTLMMSARRDVKAGQELCISYGPTFLSRSKTERMKFVSTCTCMYCWAPF